MSLSTCAGTKNLLWGSTKSPFIKKNSNILRKEKGIGKRSGREVWRLPYTMPAFSLSSFSSDARKHYSIDFTDF